MRIQQQQQQCRVLSSVHLPYRTLDTCIIQPEYAPRIYLIWASYGSSTFFWRVIRYKPTPYHKHHIYTELTVLIVDIVHKYQVVLKRYCYL